jgi:hypothetical protein
VDRAIQWYEKLSYGMHLALGWEPQQRWVAAQATLAGDYLVRGDREKANKVLDALFALWKDADPDLPLHKQIISLRDRASGLTAVK